MRSIKTFAGAALLAVSISTVASGQAGRPFHDSWFWGLKSGAMSYGSYDPLAPTVGKYNLAPFAGVDWLITRTNGGLYMSFSQAFVKTTGVILNGPTSADSGYRAVDASGLRRFDLMAMAFPGQYVRFHPYIGFGFSFKYVSDAEPAGPFPSQKQVDYAASAVNDVKAGMGPAFIGGAQYRLKRVSVFGQAIMSSVGKDFLLANGHTMSLSAEFGLRYNIGTSIDEK